MKEDVPGEFMPTKDEAMRIIWESASFSPKVETVGLDNALGRVSASDAVALFDKPNALTCRWDGIAVRFDDFAGGVPDTSAWKCGEQYAFGNTGIAMAAEFDTLIRIEDVEIDERGVLTVRRPPASRGEHTVPVASTFAKGELLVHANEVLDAFRLGLLAMGGHSRIDVFHRPVVAIIPSGNELVARGQALPYGKNVESNSVTLAGMVRSWGGEPLVWDIVPDDFELLCAAVTEAAARADVVFLNAGSSKGTDDHARRVMDTLGRVYFHRTSYGPGNHTGFCMVGNTPVLGLVGVPVGADFNAAWYGRELVARYYGLPIPRSHRVEAVLDNGYRLHNIRPVQMYVRVRVYARGGEVRAHIAGPEDPFRTAYVDANGLLLIEPQWGGVEAGRRVTVEMRLPWEETACLPEPFCARD